MQESTIHCIYSLHFLFLRCQFHIILDNKDETKWIEFSSILIQCCSFLGQNDSVTEAYNVYKMKHKNPHKSYLTILNWKTLTEIRGNLLKIISFTNKTFRNWKQNLWKQIIPTLTYHSTELKFLLPDVGRYSLLLNKTISVLDWLFGFAKFYYWIKDILYCCVWD